MGVMYPRDPPTDLGPSPAGFMDDHHAQPPLPSTTEHEVDPAQLPPPGQQLYPPRWSKQLGIVVVDVAAAQDGSQWVPLDQAQEAVRLSISAAQNHGPQKLIDLAVDYQDGGK